MPVPGTTVYVLSNNFSRMCWTPFLLPPHNPEAILGITTTEVLQRERNAFAGGSKSQNEMISVSRQKLDKNEQIIKKCPCVLMR